VIDLSWNDQLLLEASFDFSRFTQLFRPFCGDGRMAIEFACGCGKRLKAAEQHAGKRAKCNGCGQIVSIPGAKSALPSPVAAVPQKRSAPSIPTAKAVATAVPKAVPAASANHLDDFFQAEVPTALQVNAITSTRTTTPARQGVKSCPGCNQTLSPSAVICINCGYNLNTGQKMKTFAYSAPTSSYSETAKKKKPHHSSALGNFFVSRLTSGKLWLGVLGIVGGGAWLLLGLANGVLFFKPLFLIGGGVISFFTGLIDGDNAQ
jgi:hypothetical protein